MASFNEWCHALEHVTKRNGGDPMRLTVTTEQGHVFRGDSAKQIVYRMMKRDFMVTTKTDYMAEVRQRVKIIYGWEIGIANHEEFLNDLEKYGLITVSVNEEVK